MNCISILVFIRLKIKCGVIDNKGKEIISPKYEEIYIPDPTKDVFICFDDDYIILNGKAEKIFKNYEDVSALVISEATLETEKDVLKYKKGKLYGLVNLLEEEITDAIYEDISSLKNKPGVLLVKKDGLYGVLDSNGKTVIDIKYNSIKSDDYCSEKDGYNKTGYIVSEKKENGIFYGYINYKGKTILGVKYEQVVRAPEDSTDDIFLIVRDAGKKGVFRNKKQIIANNFQNIYYSSLSKIFIVQKTGKYGFYNTSGKQILKPEYTEYSMAGNYIFVKINERMMLYDVHGNLVNSNNYKSITETKNPAYFIAENDKGYYSIISKDVKIDDEYIDIKYAFGDYFIFTNKENKSGIIHIWTGIEVKPEYDSILVIENTEAIEARKYNEDKDIVDIYSKNIERVLSIDNAIIENIDENYVRIYSYSEKEYINKEGMVVSNKEVFPNAKLYSVKQNEKWGFCDAERKNNSGLCI